MAGMWKTAMLGSSFGLVLACSGVAYAMDPATLNYPTSGEELRSDDELRARHEEDIVKMHEEFRKKKEALDQRYQEKIAEENRRAEERMKRREEMAKMQEERMKERQSLDETLRQRKEDWERKSLEEQNPFVLEMKKKRNLDYGEKLQDMTSETID